MVSGYGWCNSNANVVLPKQMLIAAGAVNLALVAGQGRGAPLRARLPKRIHAGATVEIGEKGPGGARACTHR